MFNNRHGRSEQGRVHRPFATLGAVDIERVNADARDLGFDKHAGGSFGQIGMVLKIRFGAEAA